MGLIDGILKLLLFPLTPIIDPIISLAIGLVKMAEMIMNLLKMIPRILELFAIFTDPAKFIKDIFFGLFTGVYMVLEATLDMIFGDMRRAMGGDVDAGDNSGTMENGDKCIPPSMVKLMILVLCPPLALLLEVGMKGIMYVFIASVLTYFFYFPGLIYASLYVLC
jgi:uncharacterized membrane protein YqaE (UPF0057 family)